jgi:putative transposase
MLVIAGDVANETRTYRIYREEGLQLRAKRRKQLLRSRIPMLVPDAANQHWSMDFVSDQLATGRCFRALNVVDDLSREYVFQVVDFSISGHCIARELGRILGQLPKTIDCDNGPEFMFKAMYFWAKRAGLKLHFIQPDKPTQDALVKNFNSNMREYCPDLHWFASIEGARSKLDNRQRHYNHVRPHRSLGRILPAVFAKEMA